MTEFRSEIYKWIVNSGLYNQMDVIPCNVFTKEYWIDYGHLRCALNEKWITELQAKQLINIFKLQEIEEEFD